VQGSLDKPSGSLIRPVYLPGYIGGIPQIMDIGLDVGKYSFRQNPINHVLSRREQLQNIFDAGTKNPRSFFAPRLRIVSASLNLSRISAGRCGAPHASKLPRHDLE
jgi:hypothetical protein